MTLGQSFEAYAVTLDEEVTRLNVHRGLQRRIAERGTHAELVAAGGLYNGIYQRQLLEQGLGVLDAD